MLSNVLTLTRAGTAIGLAGVMLSTTAARSIVYGFSPNDPAMIAAGVAGLVAVDLAGAFVSALRATKVDPVRAVACRHRCPAP